MKRSALALPHNKAVPGSPMSTLSERLRAFPRFRPSEEGLKMALAAAQARIWEWHPDTNVTNWSDEVWGLYGLDKGKDAPGYDNWLRSVHPEDREKALQNMGAAAQRWQPFEAEWRTHPQLGPVRWLMLRAQPVQPKGRDKPIYTGIVMDITGRKRSEQEAYLLQESLQQRVTERSVALSEQERLLQNILDGIPGLVGYWTRDLVNRFANKAYIAWLGRPPEEIRNHHLRDIIGDALYEESRPQIEAALRGESPRFERRTPIPGQPGRYRYSETHYLPDIVDGTVQGFLVIVFDISQAKEAELAADAANRAK